MTWYIPPPAPLRRRPRLGNRKQASHYLGPVGKGTEMKLVVSDPRAPRMKKVSYFLEITHVALRRMPRGPVGG